MSAILPTASATSAAVPVLDPATQAHSTRSVTSTSTTPTGPVSLKPSGPQWLPGFVYLEYQPSFCGPSSSKLRRPTLLGELYGRRRARERPFPTCPWRRTPQSPISMRSSTLVKVRKKYSLTRFSLLQRHRVSPSPTSHLFPLSVPAAGPAAMISSRTQRQLK
jgi:hypothetical protein